MSENITPPTTYAQWCELFAMLAQKIDDEQVSNALKDGSFIWEKGTSRRFMQKLLDAVNTRYNQAIETLKRGFHHIQDNEFALIQTLQAFRKEVIFLSETLDLKVIPNNDREQYRSLFWNQVNQVQDLLNNIAKNDNTGKLSRIITENAVNKPLP